MTEHSAIERYIEALETKDFKALGEYPKVCVNLQTDVR